MHADRHAGRPATNNAVDEPDVELDQPVGIVAARAHRRTQVLVAEQRLGDLVDLKVTPTDRIERPQLLHIYVYYVGKKFLQVRIDSRIDASLAARVMQVRGCRNRRLHAQAGVLHRKSNLVGDDRPGAPQLPRGERRGADARDIAGVVALQVHVADRVGAHEALDLAHEPEAPRLAAKLAVGHHLQAEALLPANGFRDESIRRLAVHQRTAFFASRLAGAGSSVPAWAEWPRSRLGTTAAVARVLWSYDDWEVQS